MSTKTIHTNGTDCTSDFHIIECEVPEGWAYQESSEGARLLLHDILSHDGIPMEGGTTYRGNCTLNFQDELSGLGYMMAYRISKRFADGFVQIADVRVYRDERWDREEGETFVCFEDAVDAEPFGDGPTHPKVADNYTRVVAKDSSREAIEQSYKNAIAYHDLTGDAVQVAYANGFVHSFISEDGRMFGNLATCG